MTKVRKYSNQYYAANNVKWRHKNYERYMVSTAKYSAKRRGLEFDLTVDDIHIPVECPYLHIPLTRTQGQGHCIGTNASLDRIDPTKGYIKGNIEVVSRLANQMKQNATREQLLNFARTVLRRYS